MAADEAIMPWHVGLHDAHCHPTDINASIQHLPQMKTRTITIMASRIADQELVHKAASHFGERVVPAFGHHPWFTHLVYDDEEFPQADTDIPQRQQHFHQVLQPPIEPSEEQRWLHNAGDMISLSELLSQQRQYLQSHPLALIGEVGLDRAFRIPEPWPDDDTKRSAAVRTEGSREGRRLSKQQVSLAHQSKILDAQMRLAGEMGRAVSVHGVQVHGVLLQFFQRLWKGHERISNRQQRRKQIQSSSLAKGSEDHETSSSLPDTTNEQTAQYTNGTTPPKPFPPRICLHSYSGSVDNLKQYFHPSVPSDVYASFSIAVNFNEPDSPSCKRAQQAIQWLREDRLLIESDLHQAGPDMDDMMEQIARKVCALRGWTLDEGVAKLAENYSRFIGI